jgi:hypothetical protein
MSNKFNPSPRIYSKRNFIDLLEVITPDVYSEEDILLSGVSLDPVEEIINTHLVAADNISNILSISAVPYSQTSSLDNISGISQYFVKQNELTKITPFTLQTKILQPLKSSLLSFDTSAEFGTYLTETLLPMIRLAKEGDLTIKDNISTLSALTNSIESSSVHNYLVDNLGWFYFLNTSALGGLAWEPSGYTASALGRVYTGDTLETVDGVKGFENYIWRNYEVCAAHSPAGFKTLELVPSQYVSGILDSVTEASAGIPALYTSGTQKLDILETLLEVIYSPLYMDKQDTKVSEAFNDYMNASAKLSTLVSKGPFRKFLNAVGFTIADTTNEVEKLGLIYDIEEADDDKLQYIADLIGWKLQGYSPDKWRHQLRKAVDIYKAKGTLQALEIVLNTILGNVTLDVKGKIQELWESYLPYLIWYSLATESKYFKDLTTWTQGVSIDANIFNYNMSSIEENLKITTDYFLLDLYKHFPNSFYVDGDPYPIGALYNIDKQGDASSIYSFPFAPGQPEFHYHPMFDEDGNVLDYFKILEQEAVDQGYGPQFEGSKSDGPFGYGVYMGGESHPEEGEDPIYLSATGSYGPEAFVFNYRGHENFPMPPFEEVKYYKDCRITPGMIAYLGDKLGCFSIKKSFVSGLENFLLDNAGNASSTLGTLNTFLILTSSVELPPNYSDVLRHISKFTENVLGLWSGKSSHILLNFDEGDFDFAKESLEGDGRYGLYEASRITKQYAPAHAIPRTAINFNTADNYLLSSTKFEYLGLDHDDSMSSLFTGPLVSSGHLSGTAMVGWEHSGVAMGAVFTPSGNAGREGLNTFKRGDVDLIEDVLLSAVSGIITAPRRSLRRKNFRFTLPLEGYYDRTGFNAPTSWDPSTLEHSMFSSLGDLPLGYIPSAGIFNPPDYLNPSGVWGPCEGLSSLRSFSGIAVSSTFPFRGLSALGSDAKNADVLSAVPKYVDRGQTPSIYATMHKLLEEKAKSYAANIISEATDATFTSSMYWRNEEQSYANSAIASGLLLTSFEDYQNFSFGIGLQKLYKDYCKYFEKHSLALAQKDKTGGNIFAQVFGKGLFNCDFKLAGQYTTLGAPVTTNPQAGQSFISSSLASSVLINSDGGSGVFSFSAMHADDIPNGYPSGTYAASAAGQMLVPLSGILRTRGDARPAEFRNPYILSGVEFVDISGSPSGNSFTIFKLDNSFSQPEGDNYLIGNTIIKCKSVGGLPRIRFDLSSYGDRRNYFIKDHEFTLNIKALSGKENLTTLGGGRIGVWIHTNSIENQMWSYTPNGWVHHYEDQLSLKNVKNKFSHSRQFSSKEPEKTAKDTIECLDFKVSKKSIDSNKDPSLITLIEEDFETFTFKFDTRNYSQYNNFDAQPIIVPNEFHKIQGQVNMDSTNYYVEVFFYPDTSLDAYMLIDDISLTDDTERDNAGIPTGYGIKTNANPLKKFVKEDKLYLNKDELLSVLKFYNGLIGKGDGPYATNFAARDQFISSGIMEVSGGSRLNYRISPSWTSGTVGEGGANVNYAQITTVDFSN